MAEQIRLVVLQPPRTLRVVFCRLAREGDSYRVDLAPLLEALGYRSDLDDHGLLIVRRKQRKSRRTT